MLSKPLFGNVAIRFFGQWAACLLLSLSLAHAACAATYYVGPTGADTLSTSPSSPGSLAYAAANAPSGSTVILKDGSYDNGSGGYTVAVSGVTFRAEHWHGATIKNAAAGNLLGPAKGAVKDVCQGIVFGPCAKPPLGGWSGGGGADWKFLDCEFTQNGGMGFGNDSLVLHCVFTDDWSNSFDVNFATGFTMRDTIVRRGNRMNGDSDSIGNKEDFATDFTFDGLIDYDNMGPGLWFDTANRNWVVKNSTFFANHGGNNWYNLSVDGGNSTSSFFNQAGVPWGSGQDNEGVPVGAHIMAIAGTPANLHHATIVTKVTVAKSGGNGSSYTYTYTVSPALPATPSAGDDFAVQQGGASPGYGVMTEANPNGSFIDNVTYNNTDAGFFDADSGNGYGVKRPGLVITGNQFDYDGIAIRLMDAGPGDHNRHPGPADVSNNKFKMGDMSAENAFHWHDANPILGFPNPHYHIDFDHNVYDPDPGYHGAWAVWYIGPGRPGKDKSYIASSLHGLQDPETFDQDQHSVVGHVAFRGRTVKTSIWPAANDTDWSDVYFPNNRYAPSDSIHQVRDDETPYIRKAISGKSAGQRVTLTVFGHTPIVGSGPFVCEVYDYSGTWLELVLPDAAAKAHLDAAVPGYAVLNPSRITVTLLSTGTYALRARYEGPRNRAR